MVEQAPLKRKVAGSSPAWPTLLLLLPALALGKSAPKAPQAPAEFEVPQGTVLAVELVDSVSSAKNKTGDSFRARVEEGVYVHGRLAVPPGTTLRGLVADAVPSGRVKGRSRLAITLRSLELDGSAFALRTETLSYAGEAHTGKHLGSSIMGALQGALYGVLFGGKQGAVIGAGAGAAAGTAGSVFSGKMDVEYTQGAKLMFETLEPFRVPEPPAAAPAPPSKPVLRERPAAAPASQEAPKPAVKPSI